MTPDIAERLAEWRDMPSAEMRLRCGEMTDQEIRTVRAVLSCIIAEPQPKHQSPCCCDYYHGSIKTAEGRVCRLCGYMISPNAGSANPNPNTTP